MRCAVGSSLIVDALIECRGQICLRTRDLLSVEMSSEHIWHVQQNESLNSYASRVSRKDPISSTRQVRYIPTKMIDPVETTNQKQS